MVQIRYLVGRAGSGKTTRCLEEIRERLRETEDGGPLVMLVPEQATFLTEYALAASGGRNGTMRAQALSFRRLAFRVMQEAGGTARIPIAETGKRMLLQSILLGVKDDLSVFGGSIGQTGFLDGLGEVLREMKRYKLTAAQLEVALAAEEGESSGRAKIRDLCRVYGEYERKMAGEWMDAEDVLDLLAAGLPESAFVRDAEVWVDGFHGFTPQEFAVLRGLMRVCRSVTFSLCLDKPYEAEDRPNELDLFYPTAATMVKLQNLIKEEPAVAQPEIVICGQPGDARFRRSPRLAHLEANYRDRAPMAGIGGKPDDSIGIYAAAGRRTEVEGAARELIRLARDEGIRWREMAVIVRNMESYRDLIATIFEDYEIPYFIDARKPAVHHPLIEFVLSALETVKGGWRYEAVFRCAKSGFLLPRGMPEQAGREAVDRLENYILAYGIQGSRWTDGEPWPLAAAADPEAGAGKDTERAEESKAEGTGEPLHPLERTRRWLVEPLARLQRRLGRTGTVRRMTEAVYLLLEETEVPARLEQWSRELAERGAMERAREISGLWTGVIGVLDQLVEMLGEAELSLDLFARTLEAGLNGIRLGLVPPSLDQVLVGSVERTRSSNIRAAFVLGVNEGVLPSRMEETSLLTESERQWFKRAGLALAPDSTRRQLDEQYLVYQTLAVPSERLWLSYPLADEEGRALLPSEIIRRTLGLFPGLACGMIAAEADGRQANPGEDGTDSPSQLALAVRPAAALSQLIARLRRWRDGEQPAAVWWDIYNWFCMREDHRERLALSARALFHRQDAERLPAAVSRGLYGEPLRASVSRMETFMSCRFAHFASYGLRLRERRMYRLEAPDIGQLFHAALSALARNLLERGLDWGALTPEACREEAERTVERLIPELTRRILLSSKRYQYLARRLKETVAQASSVLGEQARRSSFRPVALEAAFGPGEALAPLEFMLEDGTRMQIVGRIDRIDMAEIDQQTYLRILDYKSSRTSLDLSEVWYGLSLQMLTYLDVAVSGAREWLDCPAEPAGVLYFHVHNPIIAMSAPPAPEQAEAERFKRYKMQGLILARSEVVAAMDGTLTDGRSEIVPVGMKKDGSYYKDSAVMSPEQWRQLRGHVRRSIRTIGTRMMAGEVAPDPYRIGDRMPCAFCAYRPVCHFDPALEGQEYRQLSLRSKEEAWTAMAEAERDASKAETEASRAETEASGLDIAQRGGEAR